MEKALKQGKRDVHQLKGKHDGLSTTVTEISRALVSFLSFMKALLTHEPISIKILKFLLKTIYISGFFKCKNYQNLEKKNNRLMEEMKKFSTCIEFVSPTHTSCVTFTEGSDIYIVYSILLVSYN